MSRQVIITRAVTGSIYRQFLPRIHAETDAVINITTGGAHTMNLDERPAAAALETT